jgi:pimeloyl-ACP methyl ester carboxylesterase
MMYGTADATDIWRQAGYVNALRHEFSLVMPDARGHGASNKPHDPDAYSFRKRVGGLTCVMDQLGIKSAHYYGYWMGAWTGFAAAKYAPERLRSLVLGGGAPVDGDPDKPDPWYAMFAAGMETFVETLRPWFGERWSPKVEALGRANDMEALAALCRKQERIGLAQAVRSAGVP